MWGCSCLFLWFPVMGPALGHPSVLSSCPFPPRYLLVLSGGEPEWSRPNHQGSGVFRGADCSLRPCTLRAQGPASLFLLDGVWTRAGLSRPAGNVWVLDFVQGRFHSWSPSDSERTSAKAGTVKQEGLRGRSSRRGAGQGCPGFLEML